MRIQSRFTAALLAKVLGNAGSKAFQGFTDALIRFDPEAATDAQMKIFQDELERFSASYIDAETKLAKEKSDVTSVLANIDKNVRALQVLKDRHDALPENDPKRLAITTQAEQLNETIGRLEEQKVLEEQEADMATELFEAVKKALDDATAKLEVAMRKRGQVLHDMKMSKMAREQAAKRVEQARQLNEIRTSGGSGDGVLDRVASVAARDKQAAKAANLAADRITTASNGGGKSGNLAEEILASTATPAPKQDPFARLASQ